MANKPDIQHDSLASGTVIDSGRDSYRIVSVLGRGGFGITYKVERLSDRITLAMKEFFPSLLCERAADSTMSYFKTNANTIQTGIDDFVTEATRLIDRKIAHPNVVSIGEVFKANNTAYYTMEFIDGCNLYQYVRRTGGKPLSVPQMLSVIRPVLQVVDILHSHRLTHLDIKHENILLTWESDGAMRPVLIDFGQSKHYDRKGNATSKLTNAGCSEGFAPPEQYMGLTKFTPQADIYALSATVLYLLTAVVPDKEMSASEITARFDRVDPTRTLIPERIRNAVIAGMRKDKDDRTQSAAELAAALGIDISTQSHEGSVTRLLNLDKRNNSSDTDPRSTVRKKLILPLAILSVFVAGVIIWYVNHPASAHSEQSAVMNDTTNNIGIANNTKESAVSDMKDIVSESNFSQESTSQSDNSTEIQNQTAPDAQDIIFVTVEKSAEFPGGNNGLMKWLSNNICYPENAVENNIQGKVIVKFVIDENGKVSNVSIARGVDRDLDMEAIRLVKKMPLWKPAENNGVRVRSYYTLPITFKLDE